jgi:hypothetical protein
LFSEVSAFSKANFTADANPVLNIDAGTTNGHFFLITGGDTNNTLKLRSVIENPTQLILLTDTFPNKRDRFRTFAAKNPSNITSFNRFYHYPRFSSYDLACNGSIDYKYLV